METEMDLGKEIYNQAIQCGFDNCGIISIDEMVGFNELYQKRVDNVPQSKYFYGGVGNLTGTRERFPWAKSIVVLTFDFEKFRYPKELQGKYAKAFFLEPNKNSKTTYDLLSFEQWFKNNKICAVGGTQFGNLSVGPLRYIAEKAGLGIVRKNNFFYTEKGSYVDLFGYVIDRECELRQNVQVIPCGAKCDLCQRACKTKALQDLNTMNPLKCVSFLTTFGNCEIPQGLDAEMFEEWVMGCDNCQDACPHNRRHDWQSGIEVADLEEIASVLSPSNYDNLSDEFLVEQVVSRSSGHLKPSDIPALRKNAARAAFINKNNINGGNWNEQLQQN